MIPGNANPLLLATAADAAAAVATKSLRFNSGDSAFLNRTPSSAGNRKKFTYSLWVKRCTTGSRHNLFSTVNASTQERIQLGNNDTIDFIYSQGTASISTTAVFRDLSAWYHIVFAVDTDQSTAADRVKLYVNGVEQTLSGTFPSSGKTFDYNNTKQHRIGSFDPGTGGTHFADCYFADIHLIDGSQLDPTSFGAYDDNGVWQAAAYSGTFGTNGFHLAFGDNSTNSALGTDSSGNDNDFTTNNLIADTGKVFTSAKIYSTFSGERAANYKVEYSDNNSTWTEAFSGVMSNNASFGIQTGTGAGDGSYGFHKYWRYVVGSVVTSHHPRVSRIILSDGEDDITIQTYTTDNNSDQGGIPAEDDTFTYTDATAASNIDSLFDVPTNGDSSDDTGAGGEVSGNYPTLNPLKKANISTSNGNLDFAHSGTTGNWQVVFSTIGMTSGKYYCEFTCADADSVIGIAKDSHTIANDKYVGNDPNGWGYNGQNGQKLNDSSGSSYGNSFTSGDVIGIAFDATNGSLYFYKNGTAQNSGTAAFTGLTDGPYFFAFSIRDTGSTHTVNFGQRSWAYSAPSNYVALNTASLPTPTIADGSTAFGALTYSGNGNARTLTGLNMNPDFIWIKSRSTAQKHVLVDSVRTTSTGEYLASNSTQAEGTGVHISGTTDGITIADPNASTIWYNDSSHTYVAWAWDAGSSTVSNTDGTITTNLRANATAGFSIATYSGSGSSGDTLGHGLNAEPEFVIVKARTKIDDFRVYHKGAGTGYYLRLNSDHAKTSGGNWQSVSSTTLALDSDSAVNSSSHTYVAYFFAPVAGYSAFGSYTGTGAGSTGPFNYCGFRPALVAVKRTDSSGWWSVWDTKRDLDNPAGKNVWWNDTYYEIDSSQYRIDILSNGFRMRSGHAERNASGGTYVWLAFAENPFQANGGLAR